MRQVHFGRTSGAFPATTSAHYISPFGFHQWTVVDSLGVPCSAAGTWSNLVVRTDVAPGNTTSNKYSFRVNGVNSTLTATIANTAVTARDTTHSVHVSAGDLVTVIVEPTFGGTPPATPNFTDLAIEFVGDTANQSVYGVDGAQPVDTRTRALFNYDPAWGLVFGSGSPSYNTVNIVATAGAVTRYDINTDTAPGGATAIVFSIYKNGVKQDGGGGTVDTRLTLSGANKTATWTGSLPVAVNDYFWIRTDFTGSPNVGLTSQGVLFVATTDGQSIVCGTNATPVSGTLTNYSVPNAGDQSNFSPWTATEASAQTNVGVTPFQLVGLVVLLDAPPNTGAPGSTKQFTFSARLNGATPANAPTVTLLDTDVLEADGNPDFLNLADGDIWDLRCVPANSPTGAHAAWAFTQQPAVGSITVTKVTTPANPGLDFGFETTNLTPATFTLQDGDSQAFANLVAGSGYGVVETDIPLHWLQGSVSVSNGSPPDNITVAEAENVTVTFHNQLAFHVRERVIRRLRRAPHITQSAKRIFINQFELILQPGLGNVADPGLDPQVMVRVSHDGGKTYEPEQQMSAGELGHYRKRVIARQLGEGRDLVFEVTVSDPIAWYLTAAFLEVEQGLF